MVRGPSGTLGGIAPSGTRRCRTRHERWPDRRPPTGWLDAAANAARVAWPVALAAWFAWHTWARIAFFVDHGFPLGIDATIYHRGVAAWLAGSDPWAAGVTVGGTTFHYAGTPVTTAILAPFGILDETLFTPAWLVLTWLAAAYVVRRLRLPWWWLLFPPLTEGMFSGNPQVVVLALLLLDRAPASALATALKVYAFVPLLGEGRRRQVAAAIALNAASVALAPGLWLDYVRSYGPLTERLTRESLGGLSAWPVPGLLAVVVAALLLLAVRDRRAAGWLAVPAAWPASQFHYSTMALPVMSPLLAVVLAVPMLQLPAWAILADVGRRLATPWVERRLGSRTRAGSAA